MLFQIGLAPPAVRILRFLEKSDMCGYPMGGNAHMLHFCRGGTRMCRTSPGERFACVGFLPGRNQLPTCLASSWEGQLTWTDFSRGEI
jgi:hypothetical protein